MSYTKNTWQNGDKITAEKLNHIEEGIDNLDNNIFVIHLSYNDNDTTHESLTAFDDILAAAEAGKKIIAISKTENGAYYMFESVISIKAAAVAPITGFKLTRSNVFISDYPGATDIIMYYTTYVVDINDDDTTTTTTSTYTINCDKPSL